MQHPTHNGEAVRVEAGIDWISCTLPTSSLKAEAWYTNAQHVILKIAKQGYELENRSMLSYDGIGAGNNFVGISDRHIFLQITSHNANQFFDQIDREDLHYTRIDPQVTIWFSEYNGHIAQEANDVLFNRGKSAYKRGGFKWDLWKGSTGSDTLYLGAPSSNHRGKIYNKYKQSELAEYTNAWRFEIQLRDPHADKFAVLARRESDHRAARILAYCGTWFATRGLEFDYFGDYEHVVIPKEKHTSTDVEAKLRWLSEQVAPTIKFLTEAGYYDNVISALDIGRPKHD